MKPTVHDGKRMKEKQRKKEKAREQIQKCICMAWLLWVRVTSARQYHRALLLLFFQNVRMSKKIVTTSEIRTRWFIQAVASIQKYTKKYTASKHDNMDIKEYCIKSEVPSGIQYKIYVVFFELPQLPNRERS